MHGFAYVSIERVNGDLNGDQWVDFFHGSYGVVGSDELSNLLYTLCGCRGRIRGTRLLAA